MTANTRTVSLIALTLAICSALSVPAEGLAVATGSEITSFDAAKGQLPEGIAVSRDALYVGIASTGEIWKVTRAGQRSLFAKAPTPVEGKGFLTGLAVASNGDVLAALTSFAPEVKPGIYRVSKDGGTATLFAEHANMKFPNGLAFAASGDLLVSDSAGTVFQVTPRGNVSVLLRDDKLTGDKSGATSPSAPGAKFGLDIGVNGIALARDGRVYAVNSDRGTILSFAFDAKAGTASALKVVAQDPARLGGADGIALLADGSFIVTLNTQDKLVRVTKAGAISDIPTKARLDFPASVVTDIWANKPTVFVTNAGFLSKKKRPGVVKIILD